MAAVDLRQVLAAFLAFSMFIMFGNMIKRDHIDPLWPTRIGITLGHQFHVLQHHSADGPWKKSEADHQTLKPCWKKSSTSYGKFQDQSNNGYIFFTLTRGPEFHASQVANAVTVAERLGAKLALPDIQGTEAGEKMKFEDIYDVDNFIEALKGVVQVEKNPPASFSERSTVVTVPNRVSNKFVTSNIEPIFRNKRNLRIVTDFNSISPSSRNRVKNKKSPNENQCLAMFETLKLKPNLQELIDSMMSTIRELSEKLGGRFIAVDLRVETLWRKQCQESDAFSKQCYNAEEIGEFLKKIGFLPETTLYLTQTTWDKSLNPLRKVFPTIITKVAIIPNDKRALYSGSKIHEYEKYIDFFICAQSDVFVPAFPDRFYYSVVGKRIGDGKTQVIVPAMDGLDSAEVYISPYIAKKQHFAYQCFC